jgi:hypothetical protein
MSAFFFLYNGGGANFALSGAFPAERKRDHPRKIKEGAMKKNTRSPLWASILIAVSLGACIFSNPTPTKILFPTPNWTMSKLFEVPTTDFRTHTPAAGETVLPQFTATISPTAPNCTNLAQFVSETIPDLTSFAPGTAFIKTWTLKNVGTCTWGRGYALAFDHGDQMAGPASIPLTASVPPGAVYTFVANLVAPASAGEYQGFWKIQTPQGLRFGIESDGTKAFWVKIGVSTTPGCTPKDRRPEENGMLMEVVFTDYPPVLGANIDTWANPLPFSVLNKVSGTTENTAKFGMRWDYSYLYLAVRVADNTFVQETSGGANLYLGDSLEILMDTDLQGDYCNTTMNVDDYQLGISPGFLPDPSLQSPSAYLWYPAVMKGAVEFKTFAILTSSPDPAGWILEVKIPWNIFGASPADGKSYGFTFSVSDNDHPATTRQDGMISTSPGRTVPTNPTKWGTMQLVAKPVG